MRKGFLWSGAFDSFRFRTVNGGERTYRKLRLALRAHAPAKNLRPRRGDRPAVWAGFCQCMAEMLSVLFMFRGDVLNG